MATLTVYSELSDGELESVDSSWFNARLGVGSFAYDSLTSARIGAEEAGTYIIYEAMVQFNTSAIGASDTVDSASLDLTQSVFSESVTVNVWEHDWGTSLDTSDWIAPGHGLTSAGSKIMSNTAVETITLTTSSIVKGGWTRLGLTPGQLTSGTGPDAGRNETISYFMSNEAGTSSDPKLVVNYTVNNLPPNAPTLVTPADSATLDFGSGQTFDWTFSDPNGGDTQGAYYFKRRTYR